MKLFCSFAFTGEDEVAVRARMRVVVDALTSASHEVYCNLFDSAVDELIKSDDYRGIFTSAFEHLHQCDAVVAIVASPNRSVGQLMELGVALDAGKPIYLFAHTSANSSSYLPQLATSHTAWQTGGDLRRALAQL